LLFSAARAQLVAEVVSPALKAGKTVLADRFGWSSLAYQGFGRGMDPGPIRELFRIACGDIWPGHSFLLDLPVASMRDRLASGGRPADRMERENAQFFERVRQGYLAIAAENADRFTLIDASRPPETVHLAIMAELIPLMQD
jgi:dTMP kinase